MTTEQDPIKDVSNPEVEALLRAVAGKMKDILKNFTDVNPSDIEWGFSMFLFEMNKDEGSTFYISTGNRDQFLDNLSTFMARNGYIVSKATTTSESLQ